MDFQKTKFKNTLVLETYGSLKSLPPLKKSTKAAYAIARTLRKMRDAVETYDEKRRELYVAHFGDDNEANSKHKNWTPFQKELRELNNLLIEVEYMRCEQSDLSEENELSPDQIANLLWITEDPPKEELKVV